MAAPLVGAGSIFRLNSAPSDFALSSRSRSAAACARDHLINARHGAPPVSDTVWRSIALS